MADRTFVDIEKLLENVDRMVEAIDSETGRYTGPSDRRLTDVDQGQAARTLETLLNPQRDGFVDLRVSSDAMAVLADVYPPVGAGKPVLLDAVELQLEKLGVVHGLLFPVIQRTLSEAALDLKAREGVMIAKGTAPVDWIPERWEVLPALAEKKRTLDDKALQLDFKEDSPFVLVKKGDLLAVKLPEQYGSQGWDVYGRPLEFSRRTPQSPQPGENVVEGPDGFRAACEGCLRVGSGSFWVDKVLVLQSGVGYETGNLDFPGEIHIQGEIASGFSIQATGSVFSNHVMDATKIISGGDIVTPLGIVGREGCQLKAEGHIRAKFLEKVVAQAKESIFIQSSILNSSVQTQNRLVMGDKGIIIGGTIHAQNGIDTFQVGTERGAKSELVCGIDYTAMEKVEWARDQCMALTKQMRALLVFRETHPAQAEKLNQATAKLRDQIRKLSEFSRKVAIEVDRNDAAVVLIRGTVHQGTYVEICHVSYVVPRTLSRVKFFLDKRKGTIVPEAL